MIKCVCGYETDVYIRWVAHNIKIHPKQMALLIIGFLIIIQSVICAIIFPEPKTDFFQYVRITDDNFVHIGPFIWWSYAWGFICSVVGIIFIIISQIPEDHYKRG